MFVERLMEDDLVYLTDRDDIQWTKIVGEDNRFYCLTDNFSFIVEVRKVKPVLLVDAITAESLISKNVWKLHAAVLRQLKRKEDMLKRVEEKAQERINKDLDLDEEWLKLLRGPEHRNYLNLLIK